MDDLRSVDQSVSATGKDESASIGKETVQSNQSAGTSVLLLRSDVVGTRLLQCIVAMLNLVRPGLQRGKLELPEVMVNSGTKLLHVQVALSSSAPGSSRAELRQTGKMAWSRDGVDAIAVPGGAILRLDIPADVLTQGTSELVVKPSGDGAISYWFSVLKLR